MFHYSLRVIEEPKISEIRILNLCHKKTILVDIYRQSLLSFMHQSIPAAAKQPPPPLPPEIPRSICPPCHSRGWGICKFCAARGPGICQPRGHSRAFDKQAVSYQHITTQRILLGTKADWLICHGHEKIREVCKGMFLILCTHFFIAYQTRITGSEIRNYRRESTFFGY